MLPPGGARDHHNHPGVGKGRGRGHKLPRTIRGQNDAGFVNGWKRQLMYPSTIVAISGRFPCQRRSGGPWHPPSRAQKRRVSLVLSLRCGEGGLPKWLPITARGGERLGTSATGAPSLEGHSPHSVTPTAGTPPGVAPPINPVFPAGGAGCNWRRGEARRLQLRVSGGLP